MNIRATYPVRVFGNTVEALEQNALADCRAFTGTQCQLEIRTPYSVEKTFYGEEKKKGLLTAHLVVQIGTLPAQDDRETPAHLSSPRYTRQVADILRIASDSNLTDYDRLRRIRSYLLLQQ